MNPPGSVLVLRFSSAGDIVLASPAIAALKRAWPSTRLVYAVKAEFADLVRHDPNIDALILAGRGGRAFLRFMGEIRQHRPEAILDLHGKLRSRLVRGLTRGVPRVVWEKRPAGDNLPVRLALRPYHARMTISDRYHAAVEALVGRPLERGHLRLYPGARALSEAETAIRSAGLDPSAPIVGMSPGANWETKRWPAERFGELARRSAAAGLQIAVTGSASESSLAAAVVAGVPRSANLCGKITLGGLGGVLSRCRAFVANDSGPMHMARALGVPTLAFFGSTDPRQFEFAGHAVEFAGVPCAPCHFYGRRRCPRGHFRCMLDLSAGSAWERLRSLLDGPERVPFVSA